MVQCQVGASCPLPDPFFNLGVAGTYTALGLAGAVWNIGTPATYIQGNVGVAAPANGSIIKAMIDGDFVVDPGVNTSTGLSINDDLNVTGTAFCDGATNTICDQPPASLAPAVSAALSASTTLAALSPTQTLGNVTGATVGVTRTAAVNVIQINSLSLVTGDTFTITGNATDVFVFNVVGSSADGAFSIRGNGQIVVSGGISAKDVLWNFAGTGGPTSRSRTTTSSRAGSSWPRRVISSSTRGPCAGPPSEPAARPWTSRSTRRRPCCASRGELGRASRGAPSTGSRVGS